MRASITSILLMAVCAVVDLWATGDASLDRIVIQTPHAVIPRGYFGVNIINFPDTHTMPPTVVGSWRTFDAEWTKIEPSEGGWNFTRVDEDVSEAGAANVDLDLVLSSTPTWASARPAENALRSWQQQGSKAESASIGTWITYVRRVAERYRGRVHTYELWNEPNLAASYTGTAATLSNLSRSAYAVLKAVDPTITVISPAFSPLGNQTFISDFLADCGQECFDVIGYHFYTEGGSPERMIDEVRNIRTLAAEHNLGQKAIWNTEAGYMIESGRNARKNGFAAFRPKQHVLTGNESADFVVRAYVLGWALGMRRFCWYAWGEEHYAIVDDHGNTPKPATFALINIAEWMTGKTMLSCSRSPRGIWNVRFRGGGHSYSVLWSDAGAQAVKLNHAMRALRIAFHESYPIQRQTIVNGSPIIMSD